MDPNIPIGCGAIYIAIYYILGRSVLNDLRLVDPDYYDYLGATRGVSARNSIGIVAIMLEDRPVEASYPPVTQRKIKLARWLFLLSPVVLIVVIAATFLA